MAARHILTEIFPTLQILEEVPIHTRRSETLYLDFYLPLIKMCVEVHGEQHFKFVPFYHNSALNFLKAKRRDEEKKMWCEKNNIRYIMLAHYESPDIWKSKLNYDTNTEQ